MEINTFYDDLKTSLRAKLEKVIFQHDWNISEKLKRQVK